MPDVRDRVVDDWCVGGRGQISRSTVCARGRACPNGNCGVGIAEPFHPSRVTEMLCIISQLWHPIRAHTNFRNQLVGSLHSTTG